MRNVLITPPAAEPITLAEAKQQVKMEDIDDDDALITLHIASARALAEVELSQSLITTTWDMTLDGWPGASQGYWNREIRRGGEGPGWLPSSATAVVRFSRYPILAVELVEYLDQAGNAQTIDPADYRLSPAGLQPRLGRSWPLTSGELDCIRIRYTAGYGPTAASVPANIKSAMLLIVGSLYINRGEEAFKLPDAIKNLLHASDHGHYG